MEAEEEEERNFSKPTTHSLPQNKAKSFDEVKEVESSNSKYREDYERRLIYECSQAFSQYEVPLNYLPPTSTLNALSQAIEKRQMYPEYLQNPMEEEEDPFRMMARAEHIFHKDSSIPLTDIEEVADEIPRDLNQSQILEEVQEIVEKPAKKRISSKRMKPEKTETSMSKASKKDRLKAKEKSPSEGKSQSKKTPSSTKGKGQKTIDSYFGKPRIITFESPLTQQQLNIAEPLSKNFAGKECSRRPYVNASGYGVMSTTSCNYAFPQKENHLPFKTITFID